jgi:hypothetical protein
VDAIHHLWPAVACHAPIARRTPRWYVLRMLLGHEPTSVEDVVRREYERFCRMRVRGPRTEGEQ